MSNGLFSLDGKIALVTGGAQGIGLATSRMLAGLGASVIIADVMRDLAESASDEIKQSGAVCIAMKLDVTDRASAAALATDVRERFGRLDILINNAGINTSHRVPIHEFPDDEWDRLLSVDLNGVFAVSKAVIPLMIEQGGGRIINISSVLGLVPARLQCAFVAGKAAVINLTRAMALELAPHGILVNGVAPGATATDAWKQGFQNPDSQFGARIESLLSHVALHRAGEPEEIAAAIVFLAMPASSYITGTTLTVDGGWTAGYTRDW